MDLDLAAAYVRKNGAAIDQARLRFLLSGETIGATLKDQVFADHREDGGWAAFWAPDYSSLDATCYRLAIAESVGLLADSSALSAKEFLQSRQGRDGSWNESPPPGVTPPPWLAPDTLATTCYLTANCGFWLYRLGAPEEALASAGEYLSENIDLDAELNVPNHLLWMAIPLWTKVSRTSRALRATSTLKHRVTELSASNLAWALTTFLVAGHGLNSPLCLKLLARLRDLQEADGSWPSDDGEAGAVHTTLEAIRLFRSSTEE